MADTPQKLHSLTNDRMAMLSGQLLGPLGRPLLDKSLVLRGFIPGVETIHANILATLVVDPHARARVELKGSKKLNDRGHDLNYTGIYYVLYGISLLLQDTPEGEEVEDTLEWMFPYKMQGQMVSYTEQVGFIGRLKPQITQKVTGLLASIKLPGGSTLEDARVKWFAAGDELAADLAQEAALGAAPATLSREESLSVRMRWLRTMNALLATLEISDLTEQGRLTVRNLAIRVME